MRIILIGLDLISDSVLLITIQLINGCRVLTLFHLLVYFGKIGLLIVRTSIVCPGLLPINKFKDRIICDSIRQRILQLFTLLKSLYEVVDPGQKSYFWIYLIGTDGFSEIILYDYQPDLVGKYLAAFLKGFSGFLHCEG